MRNTKLFLTFILCLQFFCAIIVNLAGLNYETNSSYRSKLNGLGKFISSFSEITEVPYSYKHAMSFYTLYSGTHTGYEFFSPNIASTKIDFLFLADGKRMPLPLISHESKTKFVTASYFLEVFFKQPKLRNEILKSIGVRVLSLNPQIKTLSINLSVTTIKKLAIYKSQQESVTQLYIPGFTLINSN